VARDTLAAETLEEIGIEAPVMCDPAIFCPPSVPGGDRVVIGWRGLGPIAGDRPYSPRWSGADHQLSTFLWEEWIRYENLLDVDNRTVVVHDNREVAAAREMFGAEAVRYSSDHRELMRHYWRCGSYVGARIHGFVAAVIHGATAHLIYHSNKAACADVIISRLELEGSALVTICEDGTGAIPDVPLEKPDDIWARIKRERHIFRQHCQGAPGLRSLMKE
jgi:polysaccharide pyruvyl transferase WcaK-like protein